MQPDPIDARQAELVKIAESEAEVAALRTHLTEIVGGPTFKGSPRSGRFLSFIVNRAIEGNFDALKERTIGVELFSREPSYDTGEDAIVRVTASDVRKRLLQHYGRDGGIGSGFRISLPVGSYVPEITRFQHNSSLPNVAESSTSAAPPDNGTAISVQPAGSSVADPVNATRVEHRSITKFIWAAVGTVLGMALMFLSTLTTQPARRPTAEKPVLPWSALFNSRRSVQFITSDPNIAEVQGFTGGQISLSDYANRNYLAGPNKLSAAAQHMCRDILRGDKSATIDTQIAVAVAEMAEANSRSIDVHGARDIQISDLRTDSNFIFIGSPRSNPWVALFGNQLDFRFAFDAGVKSEYFVNVRPGPGERASYVPSAVGWATGDSFAIVALVRNPDQDGHVLLLAGANAEGTKAAGKLATDGPRLSNILQHCGISPAGPLKQFELLLHLNTMAGSPSNTDVVACHILAQGHESNAR